MGEQFIETAAPQTDNEGRIAVAAYTPDENYYTEMIFLQSLKKRRVLRLGGILLMLLSGVQMLRNTPDFQRFMLLGTLSLSGLFFFGYAQYAHFFKGKTAFRKIKKTAGGDTLPQLVHEYYPDRIEVHAEQSDRIRTYPYAQISDIRQTKDLTLFVFSRQYSIAVPHRAFRFAAIETVKDHLRTNYPIKKHR